LVVCGLEPGQERSQFVGYKCGFNFRATLCGILGPERRDSLSGDPQTSSEIREPKLLQTLDQADTARNRRVGVNLAVAVAVSVGA
jgi:hypothetical protein